jgi:mRNA interferase MazF
LQAEYDIAVQPSEVNRLKKTSLIRLSKIATLDNDLIIGQLGVLDIEYADLVNKNLIRLLKLELP